VKMNGNYLVALATLLLALSVPNSAVAVSKKKVIKDFNSQYKTPAGRKVIKTKYLGKKRNFLRQEGFRKVSYSAYKVSVINLFEDCGLKVNYVWEVWYRKNKQFTQIAIWSHKLLNKPTKAMPELSPGLEKTLLGVHLKAFNAGQHGRYVANLVDTKVTDTKSSWNFCTPNYKIMAKTNLAAGDPNSAKKTMFECDLVINTAMKDGKWTHLSTNCLGEKGKETSCHYDTMCKNKGEKVFTPPLDKAKASEHIHKRLVDRPAWVEGYSFSSSSKVNVGKVTILSVKDAKDPTKKVIIAKFPVTAGKLWTRNWVPDSAECAVAKTKRAEYIKADFECTARFPMKYDAHMYKTWVPERMENCTPDGKACSSKSQEWKVQDYCRCLPTSPGYCTTLEMADKCKKGMPSGYQRQKILQNIRDNAD